jgi:hypothetical protein
LTRKIIHIIVGSSDLYLCTYKSIYAYTINDDNKEKQQSVKSERMAAQIGVEIGRQPGKKQSKAEPITATACITLTEQLDPTSHIARNRAIEQVGRWLYLGRIGLLAHVLASPIDWMTVPEAARGEKQLFNDNVHEPEVSKQQDTELTIAVTMWLLLTHLSSPLLTPTLSDADMQQSFVLTICVLLFNP